MTVLTRDFGEIEIEQGDIIHFPRGVYAFEEVRQFALLSPLGENNFPMWLQCVDDPALCFIVFNPSEIVGGYDVTVADYDREDVEAGEDEDLSYLCIAVVPEDYKKTTVNLKSPIILNPDKRLAVQIIANESYEIKHPVFKRED